MDLQKGVIGTDLYAYIFFSNKYAYSFWICRKASSAQSCRAVWSCALADLMATDTFSVDITSPVEGLWFMVWGFALADLMATDTLSVDITIPVRVWGLGHRHGY